MSEGIYTPDVTEILDLFYAGDGAEPDWAAIRSRLFLMNDSHYKVIINLLRAFWAVYEDGAAFETMMHRLKEDLPDQ
jgi:sulfur relay (sulfurtransferase) DsrC/TusE family protein